MVILAIILNNNNTNVVIVKATLQSFDNYQWSHPERCKAISNFTQSTIIFFLN